MDGMREVLAIGPARTMGNGIFDDVNEVLPGTSDTICLVTESRRRKETVSTVCS